jgi:hypothetical protein
MSHRAACREQEQKSEKRREISSFLEIRAKHGSQMKDVKETETTSSTPEELMRILDVEIASRRSHREKSSRNRAIFMVFGVLIIVIAAGAALLVLDQMLADLRQRDPVPAATSNR